MTAPGTVGELARTRSTLVCCGSGGVGKTTTAAALALAAAAAGRRACVVTIDPARRLADALGVGSLTNTPTPVEGEWPGQLWAMMLDTKSTFDELITRYASDEAQAKNILGNRLYRNLSQALSGTQEYMAIEKLYELHNEGRFDVVVVDTPPTRNALDFIDAPRRLIRFLDNRVFRALMGPTRAYLRAVGLATRALLRTVSKVVGAEVVDDAVAFFMAFEGMEEGFRERASHIEALLAEEGTAFVVVASPRADTVAEAIFFVDRLADSGIDVAGLVVNRLHPRFAPEGTAERLRSVGAEGALVDNLADLEAVSAREEAHLAELAARVGDAPVSRVPFLSTDVHDVEGLAGIGRLLAD